MNDQEKKKEIQGYCSQELPLHLESLLMCPVL